MCERFRFQKLLERPDWHPPQSVSLEIEYEAVPVEVPYGEGETSTGGVQSMSWRVVERGRRGMIEAYSSLMHEPGLRAELHDYCLEDYAHRK